MSTIFPRSHEAFHLQVLWFVQNQTILTPLPFANLMPKFSKNSKYACMKLPKTLLNVSYFPYRLTRCLFSSTTTTCTADRRRYISFIASVNPRGSFQNITGSPVFLSDHCHLWIVSKIISYRWEWNTELNTSNSPRLPAYSCSAFSVLTTSKLLLGEHPDLGLWATVPWSWHSWSLPSKSLQSGL